MFSLRLQRSRTRLHGQAMFSTNKVIPLQNQLPGQVVSYNNVDELKKAVNVNWVAVYSRLE